MRVKLSGHTFVEIGDIGFAVNKRYKLTKAAKHERECMLTEQGLKRYYNRLKIQKHTRHLIDEIRSSTPVRRVKSGRKNEVVYFPSRKMGWTVQAESSTAEFALILQLEHEVNVLEYYDQPNKIKLVYRAKGRNGKTGKMMGVLHTPDFFVIRVDGAGWIECKTEADLEKLAEKSPNRYVKNTDGSWRCPPGEAYAEQLGLFYEFWSTAEVSWQFHNNMLYLDDYFRGEELAVTDDAGQEILHLVTGNPGILLKDLLARTKIATSDDVNIMIINDQVFVDLFAYQLHEPEQTPVFCDHWTAKAHTAIPETMFETQPAGFQNITWAIGEVVTWNSLGYQILNKSETEIILRCEKEGEKSIPLRLTRTEFAALVKKGEIVGSPEWLEVGMSAEARERITQASPEQLKAAYERYRAITEPVYGGIVSERSLRRYKANYKQAQEVHRCGFVGLLDNYDQCGNHQPRLPAKSVELMEQYISEAYESDKQPSMASVHLKYKKACTEEGVYVASYQTFCQVVHQREPQEQTRKRKGAKAAQKFETFYWRLAYTTPRHGLYPLHIAHIDHTPADQELIHSYTHLNLGKAYVSTMFDAYARRVLAIHLSYDPPSYRTIMMLFRECVRRFGRLPGMIVHDGGSDFKSVYFDKLLAMYEVIKKARRKSTPRDGNVLERLFGTENVQVFYNMLGNTQLTKKNIRLVTQANNPKTLANWTLPRLYLKVREWAYEVYDNTYHPVLGQTPRQAFAAGMAQSGERRHRFIPYDDAFRFNTLPTTRKGTSKVEDTQGVKMNYIYYWNDAFRGSGIVGSQVSVRYDPENMGIGYAYIGKRWVQCISEHYHRLKGRSEKMVKLATEELRQQNRLLGKNKAISAWRIVEFLEKIEKEEQYFVDLYRDIDNRIAIGIAEGRYDELDHLGLPPSLTARLLLPGNDESKEVSEITGPPHEKQPAVDEVDDEDEDIEPYEFFTL